MKATRATRLKKAIIDKEATKMRKAMRQAKATRLKEATRDERTTRKMHVGKKLRLFAASSKMDNTKR